MPLSSLSSTRRSLIPGMSSEWPVKVVPEHRRDADRVLVDVGLDVLGADRVLVGLERDDPRLDVEVAAELLPDDVHVAAEDQIRLVGGLAGRLAPLAPLPLQRERAQHDRLRRALRTGARRLAGGVEEIREHPDAALLDLRGARVLGVVDEVAVEAVGDDLAGLRLHPGGDEGRQVALRDPIEDHLLADQPLGGQRGHRPGRHLVVGCSLDQPFAAEAHGELVDVVGVVSVGGVRCHRP